MLTAIRTSIALSLLLLYGCTSTQTQIQPAQAAERPASDVTYVAGELNEESLLDLLTAELAGQQRDFDTAYGLYLRQAQLNRSDVLAERATRIAQFKRDPDAVIESANLWLEIEPQREEPAQIMINILLHESRFAEAIDLLKQQETIGAELLIIVESLLQNFDNESAADLADLFAKRLAAQPEQLDLLLVQAKLLRYLDRNSEALTLLNSGLKIEPLQPDLSVEKAQIIRQDDPNEALSLIEAALATNRDHRQLRAVHIQLLLQLKPDSVGEAVERAITQAERDPQLIYYYALLLMENGQPLLSRNLFNDLLGSDPERTELYLYLGLVEKELGNNAAALAAYEKVESGDALLNAISQTLELLDAEVDFERAKAAAEAAEQRDLDRSSQVSVIFARWAADGGQLDAALAFLAQRIAENPNDVTLLYTRALLIEPVDTQQMLDDLERAYALNPDNAGTQNALGYSLLEHTNEYQRAYELIEQALAVNPDDPAYLDSMGWALHKLGRNADALEYLDRAYELMQDPEVASHLIIVLSELGERQRAEAILQQQLNDNPGNADIEEAQRWLER